MRLHAMTEDAGGWYCLVCEERAPFTGESCPGRRTDRSDLSLIQLSDTLRDLLRKFPSQEGKWPLHWNKLTVLDQYIKLRGILTKYPVEELNVGEAIRFVLLHHKRVATEKEYGAGSPQETQILAQMDVVQQSLGDIANAAIRAYLCGEEAHE